MNETLALPLSVFLPARRVVAGGRAFQLPGPAHTHTPKPMSRPDPPGALELPGDHLIPDADVVLDRRARLTATPEQVWPWLVQLGKGRAGWYMSRRLERL